MKTVCDHCGEFVDLVDTPENVKLERVELAWAIQCRNNQKLKAEVERLRGAMRNAMAALGKKHQYKVAEAYDELDTALATPAAEAEKERKP